MMEQIELRDNFTSMAEEHISPKKVSCIKGSSIILLCVFLERAATMAFLVIVNNYMHETLKFSAQQCKTADLIFIFMQYVSPVFGGCLADFWLGNFVTILVLYGVYAVSFTILTLLSVFYFDINHATLFIGMVLLGLSDGANRPCMAIFFGDQYKAPVGNQQLGPYYLYFCFVLHLANLVALLFIPIKYYLESSKPDRFKASDVWEYLTFYLIIVVAAVLAIVIFVAGYKIYVIVKPNKSGAVNTLECIFHASRMQERMRYRRILNDFIDYADDRYEEDTIADAKIIYRMKSVILAACVYHFVYYFLWFGWQTQAHKIKGRLGNVVYLHDEVIKISNPISMVILIPLISCFVYPKIATKNTNVVLWKMGIGGIISVLACVISAFVDLKLQTGTPVYPMIGNTEIRIYSGLACDVQVTTSLSYLTMPVHAVKLFSTFVPVTNSTTIRIMIKSLRKEDCLLDSYSKLIKLKEQEISSFFLTNSANQLSLIPFDDVHPKSTKTGDTYLRVMGTTTENINVTFWDGLAHIDVLVKPDHKICPFIKIYPTKYEVELNGNQLRRYKLNSVDLESVEYYTLLIHFPPLAIGNVRSHNCQHAYNERFDGLLWTIPQHFLFSLSEILFRTAGFEFIYREAPYYLRSFMLSVWLLSIGIGALFAYFFQALTDENFKVLNYLFFAFIQLVNSIWIIHMGRKTTPKLYPST